MTDFAAARHNMVESQVRPNGITDHRINFTLYNLTTFMDGDIQELLTELQVADVELRLAEMEASHQA